MKLLTTTHSQEDPGANDQLEHAPAVALITDMGRNFVILVGTFALYLAAFIVCVTMLGVGTGLVVLGVGLFILAADLVVASWVAAISRTTFISSGVRPVAVRYRPTTLGAHGWRDRLSDPQSWRDLMLVFVMFPVSTASFSVAVFWVAGGLGGVTYGLWSRWLPKDNRGLADVIGSHSAWSDLVANTVIGVVLLLTLPVVLRALVRLHSAIAFGLLRITDIDTPVSSDSGGGAHATETEGPSAATAPTS